MPKSEDYEVGYRKPPVQYRFQPGQTGNPAGRPKGSKNLKDTLDSVLETKVPGTLNGRRTKVSATKAVLTVQVNKALTGDRGSAKLILDLKQNLDAMVAAHDPGFQISPELRRAKDAAVLAAFKASIQGVEPLGKA